MILRWVLRKPMEFVLYRPKLASAFVKVLTLFPNINKRLISFASSAGMITQSHAPVPRQSMKATNIRVLEDMRHEMKLEATIESTDLDQSLAEWARPEGKNHEMKSPLEKWFY